MLLGRLEIFTLLVLLTPGFLAQVNAFPMATELERGYFDPKRSRLCDLSMLPGLGSR
jgi:hypothetical protein